MSKVNKGKINWEVINFLTRKPFLMSSISEELMLAQKDKKIITSICNETDIYHFLFEDKLEGKPYTLEKAIEFVDWAKEGWLTDGWYVFILFDSSGVPSGAIDIKSNNKECAEVGYWLSHTKSGVMTNAMLQLIAFAKDHGYKKLFGMVRTDNPKSARVLERTGYEYIRDEKRGIRNYHRYELFLK
jgi:RimJ/RimL family protein N-acetyltransferase